TTIDAGAGLPEGELGSDTGTDAGTDTGTDAGTDTGTDAGTDTGTDADTGCVASEAELRERRHAYTEAALVAAMDRTPAGLAVQARRLAERYAQVPLDVRHARARRHRRVWVTGRDDGMADLTAFLPATEAYAIRDRLTRMARSITDTERHDTARTKQATQRRSRDEVRADVLTDLLLGGDPDTGGRVPVMPVPEAAAALTRAPADMGAGLGQIRAVVQVITPAHVLPAGAMPPGTGTDTGTGADTDTDTDTATPEPGDDWPHMRPELPELVGYGPIDTVTVRRLAGHAPGWDLTREHPVTGAILGVDRYRPTEQMRRLLRARDQHCRFPGCRAPAHRCDIDHTLDWADGGRTETSNLAHLCRGHHTLKHHTGWQVRQENDGVLVWTAPTGRKHATYPERGRDKRDHDKRDPGSGPPGNGRPSNVRFTPAPETEPSTPSASGNGIPY
ncbi:MAG: HNH endonuclease, partial [Actinobacteria bacterium]|nr:HNH endonuclease [Actinomycetota bacterium]